MLLEKVVIRLIFIKQNITQFPVKVRRYQKVGIRIEHIMKIFTCFSQMGVTDTCCIYLSKVYKRATKAKCRVLILSNKVRYVGANRFNKSISSS